MAVQTQIQTRRGTAATWTSTNPTLAAGEIGFESDTGKFKIGTGSTAWNSLTYSAGATAVTYLYNATSGQTTFSGADANGLTLAYTVGAEQVFLNGVLQVRGSDYTGTTGTSIVLTSGAVTSDVLNIIAYSALTITDTYTQAQADAKFVQQTNNFFAGKNKFINGDFGVWQRGAGTFTKTTGNEVYTADRWVISNDAGTITCDRQTFTPGTAPVAGYEGQYFARITTTASSGNALYLTQKIEDVRTFAGQTITFSYWAKVSSGTLGNTPLVVQDFATGGSAAVVTSASGSTLTTSWQRFTHTVAVPSISGKTIGTGSCVQIQVIRVAASATIDIWGVQVEAGSIATPFQTATGTIQGELAACQRYYYRVYTGGSFNRFGTAQALSLTAASAIVPFPVTMRTAPTAVEQNGTAANYGVSNATYGAVLALTVVPAFDRANTTNGTLSLTCTSGLVAGNATQFIDNNSTAAYLGWSAEL